MFFKRKFLQKSYFHVSLCLFFLFSGSVIGCLQEESPSPLERKLQELVLGSADWIDNVAASRNPADPLTSNVKMEKTAEYEKYNDLIELIPLHQE